MPDSPKQSSTDDLRIAKVQELIPPSQLQAELPIPEALQNSVAQHRKDIEDSLFGRNSRLAVVVGPCSIHDESAALEYADKLKKQAERFSDDLCVVMRVYFEKPRTTVGWKGYINDPGLDESFDINRGLKLARNLLLEVAKRGLPAGTEFLDTISPQYIADLVSWGAIGARTVESQVHRELASGLSMPIGFKNGTKGGVEIAMDAIGAARGEHHFLGVTKNGNSAILATKGNPSCHIILRGGKDGPNFDAEHIHAVGELLEKRKLSRSIMVDCSHGNSNKDHRNQPKVAANLAGQISRGDRSITGIMLESHLVEGTQKVVAGTPLTYGQSITDACISWDDTIVVLETLAKASAQRKRP
jgi:3-deoxy-7-phosphoheptulonate synthase